MNRRFAGLASVAWRESRTARRRLLLYMSSITLGVAALVAIDSYAENAYLTVGQQARSLVGGDLSLTSRDSFTTPVLQLFDSLRQSGVGVAQQTTFASMAVGPDTTAMRLSQVRAITPGFPYYGDIETEPAAASAALHTGAHAIVDASLLVALSLNIGDSISLGAQKFAVTGTIVSVPGEVAATALLGPRVYIPAGYLARTNLLVFGSRADYRAVVKLPATLTAERFESRYRSLLGRQRVRIRTVADNEANLTEVIDHLRNFLSMVGLIALLLGGIGVASGVNAFVLRKIDTVAVLRCLGATSWQVVVIYVLQAAAMGLVGAIAGTVLGVAAQFTLPRLFADFLPRGIVVAFAPRAVVLALGIGVWVALVFSLRPLLALKRVSPLQALRREADSVVMRKIRRDSSAAVVSFATVASIFALTLSRADEWVEGLGYAVAILASVGVLWVVATVLTNGARRLVRSSWPFVFRHAVASLYRPGNQTRAVVLALGFGVFLMSTLYQAETNLRSQIDRRMMQLKANLVFFDIQGSQAPGLDSIIRQSDSKVLQSIPILTVRMAAINGKPLDTTFTGRDWSKSVSGRPITRGERAARLRAFLREWRTTWSDTLDAGESVVKGKWFTATNDTMGEVSFDSVRAEPLGIVIGDTITWNVQGRMVTTRVGSMRNVDRTRLQPTFPVIFSPHTLEGAPAQYVFLVSAKDARTVAVLQRDVARRFANVASLDLSLVQQTINGILGKVTTAIKFMALISLMLAIPVLFSAVAATRRERLREGVLLKTIGATRHQVGLLMLAEYLMLGGLGSAAGVLLSGASTWGMLHFVFKVAFVPAVLPAVVVCVGMTLLAALIGVLTSREVFATTPMAALREG